VDVLRYRADITGLRALAVVPVVIFHGKAEWLPGGFLGVDIFFVISGFLITSILVREMEDKSFSLLGFYRRRVVRILPALLAMVVLVCAAGCLVLLPGELSALAESAAAAAGFVSNLYFWRESAYFAGAVMGRPLLHTWSLGVEEQFYILYPLLLLAARRLFPGRLKLLVTSATAVSLAASLTISLDHPMPAFYLLPTRAWELGLGAMVALGAFPRLGTGPPARLLPLAAIAAMLLAFVLAGEEHSMRWAVLPASATAVLIACGAQGPTGRLLALAPFTAIGLISYSVYLWHWPLIAFYRIGGDVDLDAAEMVGLGLASLVLGWISYAMVERPFLRRCRSAPAWPVVALGLLASLLVAAAALVLARAAPLIRSIPAEAARFAAFSDYRNSLEFRAQRRCTFLPEAAPGERCPPLDPRRRNLLLLGDSHARHVVQALQERFRSHNVVPASVTGCRPVLGGGGARRCARHLEIALEQVIPSGRVSAVILAARWTEDDVERLEATISAIRSHGVRVTVLGPVVEYEGDMPQLLARASLRRDRSWVDRARRLSRESLDRRMEAAVRRAGAQYYSMYRQECPPGRLCRLLTAGGMPMHFDYGHLTVPASIELLQGLGRL
jgi:peptidoglycan/LPS O-acetylase OafA/YrhL